MNLRAHYESYKKSFENTMLEGYVAWLKKEPCPEVFPTMLERVENLVEAIETKPGTSAS